jgi:hypothetical protein
MTGPYMKTLFATLVTLACCLTGGRAFAQTLSAPEENARDALIKEGQVAHKEGDHRRALERAERAAAIKLTPSLRYFLGFEQQELGRLAEAYANAQRCARELELDPKHPDAGRFLGICQTMRDQLASRVGSVIVAVADYAPPGTEVRVNGTLLNHALFGVAVPVTPGNVTVEATAPGRVPFRKVVIADAGAKVDVAAVLLPESAAAAMPSPGQSAAAVELADPRLLASEAAESAAARRRWGGVAAIGGGALLAASAGTWLVSQMKFSSLRDDCDRKACTRDDALSGKDTIQLLDRLAVGGAITGAALLISGTALRFTAPKPTEARLEIGLLVGPTSAVVTGRF